MEATEFFDQYAWLVGIAVVWELIWKGMALWRAARSNEINWYIALLLINSAGLLPILYLRFFSKSK